MPANKSNARVVIVEQNGEFFVQPAAVVLEKGANPAANDTVKIYNATKEDAIFRIPSALPFGTASQLEIIPSKKSIIRQVDNGAVADSYDYQILMLASGKKAKGNSDPVIIIEN